MKAGELRSRIVIQRRLPGGGLGQPSNHWEEVARVRANIRFGSGSEAIRSGQPVSQANCSIRIRRRSGVAADMRVLCEGVAYEIKAVLPDLLKREHLDLVCVVVGNGAG